MILRFTVSLALVATMATFAVAAPKKKPHRTVADQITTAAIDIAKKCR